MSILPGFVNSDLGPLFRLLDDYDTHRLTTGTKGRSSVRAFQPKFDVKETKNSYELYGELCGIEQDEVSVEFSDPHTIVIKGRIERSSTNGSGRITGEAKTEGKSYHKPTAEDETEDTGTPTTVTKKNTDNGTVDDGFKYWITERSVGEFHRSFSFPSRVDQDAVKATLKNGILTVIIPKAQAPQSRRIQITS